MKKLTILIGLAVASLILLAPPLLHPRVAAASGPASDPGITAETVEVIPYQATGYRFDIFAPGNVPVDYGNQTFDDSSFSIGDAAFGQSGDGCVLQPTVNTNWPLGSEIVVRKTFSLPAGSASLRIMVSVDNDVEVFLNGQDLSGGLVQHDGCPVLDEFRFDAPDALLKAANNVVAVRGRDRGVESFLDLRILVEPPPDEQININVVDKLSGTKLEGTCWRISYGPAKVQHDVVGDNVGGVKPDCGEPSNLKLFDKDPSPGNLRITITSAQRIQFGSIWHAQMSFEPNGNLDTFNYVCDLSLGKCEIGPVAVGGLVVDLDEGPQPAAQPSGASAALLAGTIAGVVSLAIALSGAAWYARRRWG